MFPVAALAVLLIIENLSPGAWLGLLLLVCGAGLSLALLALWYGGTRRD